MRRKLIFFCYRILITAGLPFILIYILFRAFRDKRYLRGLTERFGFLPDSYQRTLSGALWLHAVSVGEVLSSAELIRRLRSEHPGTPLFVSCGTLTGRKVAEDKLSAVTDGIFYLPLDFCFAVRRVLRRIRPSAVIILETEIWPNLYRESKRIGAALVIVNGRISPRALPKYLRFGWFFASILDLPDHILVQSEEDRKNYMRIGAPRARITTAGNLKYDFNPRSSSIPAPVQAFLDHSRPSHIWIAASTTEPTNGCAIDEDDAVIEAFLKLQTKYPGLLLVIAPRKPERFDVVAAKLNAKLNAANLSFTRRTTLQPGQQGSVLLLDSIGELSSLFGLADIVLMGGTLTNRGGHNILEPAFFGNPIIIGPHMENFPEIAARFIAGDAVKCIEQPAQLEPAVDSLLSDRESAKALGERARILAEAQRGATDRALKVIAQDRSRAIPHVLPYAPIRPALALLSRAWRIGGKWKRRRGLGRQKRLDTPVISIGGIAMGGTGKTPMVSFLAEKLRARGYKPAILTRGYRRSSSEPLTILAAGKQAPAAVTGDEPQIFLRDGLAALGIGTDRYEAGKRMEQEFQPDVFLLDDGFQHAPLHRDFDLVLIDGLDPLAGGEVFPLGRLREPLSALRRASAFVITRTSRSCIHDVLSLWNPRTPVFESRVVPAFWVDVANSARSDPAGFREAPVAAFCGLANPDAFRATLASLGISPLLESSFRDHHRYTAAELQQFASKAASLGATALLTTEKDSINLPPDAAAQIAPLKLFWLKIKIEVDNEDALLDQIVAAIRSTSSNKRL